MNISFFIQNIRILFAILVISTIFSCKNAGQETEPVAASTDSDALFFEISLAQWSLNRPIFAGELDPLDFAEKANELGFGAIEYVSGLYVPQLEVADDKEAALKELLDTLLIRSKRHEVKNLLIMVDGEGELASPDEKERDLAVENHKKWVDAAQFLGCHSIRVNLFGSDDPEIWKEASIDGLTKLSRYAGEKGINILVENHGYLSSNAELLAEVMQEVALENCGTLPDFGNFCLQREGGARWQAACVKEYPKYQGVKEMMPYAKAVSAKSYGFNESGEETTIDYGRMLQIVKEAGYRGYIGVEYEGEQLSAEEGIMATKNLLIKEGKKLMNP